MRITLCGFALILIGILTTPTPLPFGIVLIPAGLIVLSLEYPFAERVLRLIETRLGAVGRKIAGLNRRARAVAVRVLGEGSRREIDEGTGGRDSDSLAQ